MSSEYLASRPAEASATGRIDAAGMPGSATTVAGVARPAVEVDVANIPIRDHVRWGPVLAGVITGLAVMLFLTILGIALGLTALGTDDPSTWGTAAGIWGGLSLLVSFFIGGWMSARAAATEFDASGPLNGFVTGAATLLLLVWLATTALTGALGFFAGTIADIAGAAAPAAMEAVEEGAVPAGTTVEEAVEDPAAAVPEQVDEAATAAAQTASETAGPGAWGTAIAIALAVAAATLGGMVGQNTQMMMPGSRSVVSRA